VREIETITKPACSDGIKQFKAGENSKTCSTDCERKEGYKCIKETSKKQIAPLVKKQRE